MWPADSGPSQGQPSIRPPGPTPKRYRTVRDNDPREVAQAHLFLVSQDASYINGQVIVADLGATNLAPDWPPPDILG